MSGSSHSSTVTNNTGSVLWFSTCYTTTSTISTTTEYPAPAYLALVNVSIMLFKIQYYSVILETYAIVT